MLSPAGETPGKGKHPCEICCQQISQGHKAACNKLNLDCL
jgi:hypothetical protein